MAAVTTFVHTADLHLDGPLRGLSPRRPEAGRTARDAAAEVLEPLADLVLAQGAAALVVAGDLWDRDHHREETVRRLREQAERLHAADAAVVVADGPHDTAYPGRLAWPLPPNVHRFGPGAPRTVVLDGAGLAFHGSDTAPRPGAAAVHGLPAPVPGAANVGVLHVPFAPAAMDALERKGYDYWALGHEHRRTVVSADPWIVYPGTPQGRHSGEPGPKGATVADVGDGRVTGVRHHELAGVRWERLEVDCAAGGLSAGLSRAREALGRAVADLSPGQRLAAELVPVGPAPSREALSSLTAALDAEAPAQVLSVTAPAPMQVPRPRRRVLSPIS